MSEETVEERLKRTVFLVEATRFEQQSLWVNCAKESDRRYHKFDGVTWKEMHGWMITIGHIGDRPVCMSLSWVEIDGQLVAFWYLCSALADYDMAEKWLAEHFTARWDNGTRRASTNAQNFAHCIHAIMAMNKEK